MAKEHGSYPNAHYHPLDAATGAAEMTAYELQQAIEQAHKHVQDTPPGLELQQARRQLTMLRCCQMARASENCDPELLNKLLMQSETRHAAD